MVDLQIFFDGSKLSNPCLHYVGIWYVALLDRGSFYWYDYYGPLMINGCMLRARLYDNIGTL